MLAQFREALTALEREIVDREISFLRVEDGHHRSPEASVLHAAIAKA
jgi:hypothetical protein